MAMSSGWERRAQGLREEVDRGGMLGTLSWWPSLQQRPQKQRGRARPAEVPSSTMPVPREAGPRCRCPDLKDPEGRKCLASLWLHV